MTFVAEPTVPVGLTQRCSIEQRWKETHVDYQPLVWSGKLKVFREEGASCFCPGRKTLARTFHFRSVNCVN